MLAAINVTVSTVDWQHISLNSNNKQYNNKLDKYENNLNEHETDSVKHISRARDNNNKASAQKWSSSAGFTFQLRHKVSLYIGYTAMAINICVCECVCALAIVISRK